MRPETCYTCGEKKERRAAAYCNKCQRVYNRADYVKNKEKYVAKAKKNNQRYKQEMYEWLLAYYSTHPCVTCGETDPIVLDFDHRDGAEKEDNVSSLMWRGKYRAAKKEIVEKCDVLCSHCHRRKTAREGNWYWLKVLGLNAPVAQLEERTATNGKAGNSSFSGGTKF